MHIGIAGPVSLGPLKHLLPNAGALPKTYSFPLIGELASRLVLSGHRVTVFAGSDEITQSRTVEHERLSVVFVPRRKTWQAYDWYRFERRWLEQAMRDSRCDLIHAHWCYEFGAAGLSSGIPCLVTVHDSPKVIARFFWQTKAALFWGMRSLLGRHVLKRAKFVSGVSPYILENARSLMKNVRLARVVPNGVDEKIFGLGLQRPQTPGDAGEFNVYSILEGFGVRKNATAALLAFSRVKRQLPQARFHLIGSGYEPNGPANCWATSNGVDDGCVFRGFVEQGTLFQEISHNAHMLLHPSLEESFSMAILEAVALSIPVVASRNAGGPSFILDEGRLGCLIDVTSVSEMADAMLRISYFPEEARVLASRCREYAKARFTFTSMTDRYLQFYSDILSY